TIKEHVDPAQWPVALLHHFHVTGLGTILVLRPSRFLEVAVQPNRQLEIRLDLAGVAEVRENRVLVLSPLGRPTERYDNHPWRDSVDKLLQFVHEPGDHRMLIAWVAVHAGKD